LFGAARKLDAERLADLAGVCPADQKKPQPALRFYVEQKASNVQALFRAA
jgi:hypothetical protein